MKRACSARHNMGDKGDYEHLLKTDATRGHVRRPLQPATMTFKDRNQEDKNIAETFDTRDTHFFYFPLQTEDGASEENFCTPRHVV